MLNTLEQQLIDAINPDDYLKLLNDLVSIKSLAGEGEVAAQEFVADTMHSINLEVDQWELDFDSLSQHPAFSIEVERERGLGVVGSYGSNEDKTLILNGHVDVVPIDDPSLWHYPPWEATLDDGLVYGRGALDMKGADACALYALKLIQAAGVKLKGKVLLQSVIGEEDGGVGTLAAIERGYRADAAVVMEPTELAIAPAQAGAFSFRVGVRGKAAHGAMRPEGVSAIEKFYPLYEAIMQLETERNQRLRGELFADYEVPFPITIGILQAGTWASNVPENLFFEGRYGIGIGEDTEAACRELEQRVLETAQSDDWLKEHLPTIEWWGAKFMPVQTDPKHPIVLLTESCLGAISDNQPAIRGMTYGADMHLLVQHGNMPTILFGPGDVRYAHRPDEHIALDDLVTMIKTLILLILRYCEVEEQD